MKTDDLLDHPDSFERRLRDGLEHIAHADPVMDPGRFDPDADTVSVERQGDARPGRWFAGAAAAAVVALGVGGLVVLERNDESPNAPADQPATDAPGLDPSVPDGAETTVPPTTASAVDSFANDQPLFATSLLADQVPVVALDDAATTYAQSQSYPGPFGGGFAGATVLVPADGSWDLPRIAIDVVERSAANGNETLDISEFGEPIEMAGTTGYLSTESSDVETGAEGPIHLLFFDVDDSRYVRVNAAGVGVGELVSIVNTYDPATGAVDVPDGYHTLPMPGHDLNNTVEFRYDLDGREIELQGSSRGAEFLLGMLGSSLTSTQVIDGVDVSVRSSAEEPNRHSVFWINGDWAFRANFAGIDGPAVIPDLLRTFRLADDATFAAGFEDDVVTDSTRAVDVEAMLADVELPPSFDVGRLIDRRGVNVRYQEIAAVSGAVACSWMDIYFDNIDSEPAAAQAAADALADSTEWDMLMEIEDQGGWSSAVWETAAAINGDGLISTGAGGQTPTRESSYPGLGCDTR